jgi:hypothetical protein
MPAATAKGKRRSPARKRKSGSGFFRLWWPLLLGLAVTPFTVHAASILALEGPAGLRMLYPYVLLAQQPSLDFSQWMMYLQFPLYGLLMVLVLRFKGIATALGAAIFVHAAGILAQLAMAHMGSH